MVSQGEEATLTVVVTVAVVVAVAVTEALVAVDVDALDVHVLDADVLGVDALAAAAEVLAAVSEELAAELEASMELAALVDGDLLRDEDLAGALEALHDLLVHDGLLEDALAVAAETLVTALLGQLALDELHDLDGSELGAESLALHDLHDLDDSALGSLALDEFHDLDDFALGGLALDGLSLDDLHDLDSLDCLDDLGLAGNQLALDDLHDLELRLKGAALDDLAPDCDGLLDAHSLDQARLVEGQEDTRAGVLAGSTRRGWREKSQRDRGGGQD